MVTTIGVIGGSGLLKTELPVFKRLARVTEQTPAVPAILHVGTIPGTDAKLVFCQRHTAAVRPQNVRSCVLCFVFCVCVMVGCDGCVFVFVCVFACVCISV